MRMSRNYVKSRGLVGSNSDLEAEKRIDVAGITGHQAASQFGEEGFHSSQTPLQVVHGHCVGDADVLSGTEAFSGHSHDVRFMQQSLGNIRCRAHATAAKEL